MTKTFTPLAAALLLCFGTLTAQAAEVGIRGAVDLGLTYTDNDDGSTFAQTSNNYVGSEITIFGEEELANKNKIGFVLTNGFNVDDGNFDSEPRMFNHESQIYVAGSWGQFGMGRMSSFATGLGTQSWYVAYDAFEAGYADAGLQATQQTIWSRYSNSFYYTSPRFNNFQLGLFYSLTGEEADAEEAHFQDNERYWNVALRWDTETAGALLSFEGTERSNLNPNRYPVEAEMPQSGTKDGYIVKAAARYDFGFMRVLGGYTHAEHQDNYAFATWIANDEYRYSGLVNKGIKSDAVHLGIQIPINYDQINIQYQYMDGTNEDLNKDFERHVIAVGYNKWFSPRTMLYTVASYSDGSGALNEKADVLSNSTAVHVGLSHFF